MKNRHQTTLCLTLVLLAMISIAWTPWSAIYETARDERSMSDIATDKHIALTLKGKLGQEDSVNALKVHVYCFMRHVYLVGAIDDVAFKSFAVKTAKAADKVRLITPYFVKESSTTTDDIEIAARVRAALVADTNLSATQIETEVMNHEVVLLGMVRSKDDAKLAIKIAKETKGVNKVKSFLIAP